MQQESDLAQREMEANDQAKSSEDDAMRAHQARERALEQIEKLRVDEAAAIERAENEARLAEQRAAERAQAEQVASDLAAEEAAASERAAEERAAAEAAARRRAEAERLAAEQAQQESAANERAAAQQEKSERAAKARADAQQAASQSAQATQEATERATDLQAKAEDISRQLREAEKTARELEAKERAARAKAAADRASAAQAAAERAAAAQAALELAQAELAAAERAAAERAKMAKTIAERAAEAQLMAERAQNELGRAERTLAGMGQREPSDDADDEEGDPDPGGSAETSPAPPPPAAERADASVAASAAAAESRSDSRDGRSDSQDGRSDSQDGRSDSRDGRSDAQDGPSDSQDAQGDSQDGPKKSQDGSDESEDASGQLTLAGDSSAETGSEALPASARPAAEVDAETASAEAPEAAAPAETTARTSDVSSRRSGPKTVRADGPGVAADDARDPDDADEIGAAPAWDHPARTDTSHRRERNARRTPVDRLPAVGGERSPQIRPEIAGLGAAAVAVVGAGLWWILSAPGGPAAPATTARAVLPEVATTTAPASTRSTAALDELERPGAVDPPRLEARSAELAATDASKPGVPRVDPAPTPGAAPRSAALGAAETDAPTWMRNAVAVNPADETGKPMIAVVIDDMGVERDIAQAVIDLDPPLTLAFLPYAEQIGRQTKSAREAGHELMVHVPMEPRGSDDPGANALRVDQAATTIQNRLNWSLSQFGGIVGINNHMGSRFTADEARMRIVLAEVRKRELLFLDSLTSPRSVGWRVAKAAGVPYTIRDVFLDNEADVSDITGQLLRLEAVARRRGSAVGIGHPFPETVEALRTWIPKARARGFVFVPVSAVVRHQRGVGEPLPQQSASR